MIRIVSHSLVNFPDTLQEPLADRLDEAQSSFLESSIRDTFGYEDREEDESSVPVKVCIRVRPLPTTASNRRENSSLQQPLSIDISEDHKHIGLETGGKERNHSRDFQFDWVFENSTTQESMFQMCGITELIDAAIEG